MTKFRTQPGAFVKGEFMGQPYIVEMTESGWRVGEIYPDQDIFWLPNYFTSRKYSIAFIRQFIRNSQEFDAKMRGL